MQIHRSDGFGVGGHRALCAGLALGLLFATKPAEAQTTDPDLREIIPFLMLVIDTSGSMERLTSCTCTTPGCTECLPDCSLPNVGGLPPVDVNGNDLKKNRWATTLEALTGTINDFQCTPLDRTVANGMTYDVGYYMPYNQPWQCNSQLPNTPCAYNSTNSAFSQNSNGVIDQYAARVQFGLMTFDGMDTYVGAGPLVPAPPNGFDVTQSNSVQGLWSYGGYKVFHYPNCTTDYAMDTGARSPIATEGSLISLNSCSGAQGTPQCQSWCSLCPGTQDSINQDIQTALVKARPFGGTPIAGALDDLYFHLHSDLTDVFGSCRNRYALLMTDGYPDDDYRSYGCDCQNTQSITDPNYCGNDPLASTPGIFKCPYKTPEQLASDLIHGRMGTTDPPQIQQLFVVGLAVNDTNVLTRLDAIAHAGCPNATGCDTDHDGHEALFANNLNNLVQNLSAVINGLIHPVSRSVPAFAVGGSAITVNTQQYQVNTGFKIAATTGTPWTGVIERQRFTCDATETLQEDPIDPLTDRFDNILNTRPTPRVLRSVLIGTGVNPENAMFSGTSTDPCQTSGCVLLDLKDEPPQVFGLAANNLAGRDLVSNWMYGINGSPRVGMALGDIYHSSAVILSAPKFDTSDEAFNLFRQRTEVANRPLTMFVASNDGILHAFSMEAFTAPTGGTWNPPSYAAGEEMWGFVPPMLLNDLPNNLNAHQFTLDGTAVVKNVYFHKDTAISNFISTNTDYHTILVIGMREGGNGYIALDVTDVTQPQFLWQFTDPHMGKTFGQAAIGQATFKDYTGGGSGVIKNGAVVILPGGVGQLGESGITGDCTNHVSNPSMRQQSTNNRFTTYPDMPTPGAQTNPNPFPHRADVRCWKDVGRALYFVDAENGRLLKKIHTDASGNLIFPSPLVSTPVLYQTDVGTFASRAFLTDADGVIWRVDVSAPDQDDDGTHMHPLTGWTARPFHDLFWDMGPADGELSYEAPILSIDPQNRLVVIVGTGDTNNFVKPTIQNRVVSVTESLIPTVTTASGTNPEEFTAVMNWEKRVKSPNGLVPSELVTGTMGLFDGQLYFGTFMAVTGSNACDLGKGRIFAVDYQARDPSDSNGTSPQTYGPLQVPATELGSDPIATSVINVDATAAVSNFMVMGLGVTERPTCQTLDTPDFNVWGQSTFGINTAAQPSLYLVAQASGDKSTTSVVQQHAGSALGSVEVRINKKNTSARVTSWATSID